MATRSTTSFPILIKPASGRCDLACTYCFYREHRGPLMPLDLYREIVRQYERIVAHPTYVWQGGEPTLMGLEWFLAARAMQRPDAANAIQTNGTLLTPEWCDWLAAERFLVGLSIDGPDNSARGVETERLERAAEMLRAAGVEYNVLCVVHEGNADHGAEVVRYLATVTRHVQFIAAKPVRVNFARFLADARRACPSGLVIENYAQAAMARRRIHVTCETMGACGTYLLVESDGSLYPCDWYVRPEWRLGSVQDGGIRRAWEHSSRMREFRRLKPRGGRDGCARCALLAACGRGCPADDPEGWERVCEARREVLGASSGARAG